MIVNFFPAFFLFYAVFYGVSLNVSALSVRYYAETCPYAEMIVSRTVDEALQKDPTLAAGLLRMHFHDCFVEGCDASVLIDSTKQNKAEKDSPANLSLRGFEVIDQAKEEIEQQCERLVSCADIVAIAARDAVYWAGGPYYDIPLGRRDGFRSQIQDTVNLPPPTLNTTGLINIFSQHGFTVEDMVALSGGHTLGSARCASFKGRLKNFDSIHDIDPLLDPYMANMLSETCKDGDDAEAELDWTSTSFDNTYFDKLREGAGLLSSDQALYTDTRTVSLVETYAQNKDVFFRDFAKAMWKMGLLNIKEGKNGDIRLDCHKLN